jgi:uncharacterized protein (DUF2252 family)
MANENIEKTLTAQLKDIFADLNYSRAEATAYGKSLRERATRVSQATWTAGPERRNPIDILVESSEGRLRNLIPIRYGRMAQSPFAFYRGAAAIMAADLATTPSTGLYVQSCGDCHLLNFGGYATPERKMIFDINDFDETLLGPWEWDVKRLATSFFIASKTNDMDADTAQDIARECVESYKANTAKYASMSPLEIWYSQISVDDVMELINDEERNKKLMKRIENAKSPNLESGSPELTEIKYGKSYIKDQPPLIYHIVGEEDKEYHEVVEVVFQKYFDSLGNEKKILLNQYKYQDTAIKVVGIGSVGTMCGISLRMSSNNDPLFLQIKEARPSVLEPYIGKTIYENNGQRVVTGQKLMQAASDIFLGWTIGPKGRHFYVRQLKDMKIRPKVEVFGEEEMRDYAKLCGWALARAHARSGKSAIITGYLGKSSKFEDAIAQFAAAYAAQNEKDYLALKDAIRNERVQAYFEEV